VTSGGAILDSFYSYLQASVQPINMSQVRNGGSTSDRRHSVVSLPFFSSRIQLRILRSHELLGSASSF
jgi:hypothetical protein